MSDRTDVVSEALAGRRRNMQLPSDKRYGAVRVRYGMVRQALSVCSGPTAKKNLNLGGQSRRLPDLGGRQTETAQERRLR